MSSIRTPDVFWKITGSRAPWGDFDPSAQLSSSFDLALWVATAGTGLTVTSCEVADDPLLHAASMLAANVATVQIKAAEGQTLLPGAFLWFRLRMTLSDGQRDDRSFWLLVRER